MVEKLYSNSPRQETSKFRKLLIYNTYLTHLSELFLHSFTGAAGRNDVDIEKIEKFSFADGQVDIGSASITFAKGKVSKSLDYLSLKFGITMPKI